MMYLNRLTSLLLYVLLGRTPAELKENLVAWLDNTVISIATAI